MAALAGAAVGPPPSSPHSQPGASRGSKPSWLKEPQEALERLAAALAQPLGGRPGGWGESRPVLLACLGELELMGAPAVPYGTPERGSLERHAMQGLAGHFGDRLRQVDRRGTAGGVDSRLELVFDSSAAAVSARQAAADSQRVAVPAAGLQPAISIPVRMGPGRLLCTHTTVIVHSLPAEFRNAGLGAALLACAGYAAEECTVRGEFVGELPKDLAACGFGAAVGHGSACLIYVQTPEADRHLGRLPRFFMVDGHRVSISRPQALRQWSSVPGTIAAAAAAVAARRPDQAQAAAASTARPTGPRAIRLRQRATLQATRPQAAPPADSGSLSVQLQHLQAAVRAGRTPGRDRRGLGCHEPAQAPPGRIRLGDSQQQQPTPMDCQTSAPAEPPHSRNQATAMEVDTSQPAPGRGTATAMEWDSAEPQHSRPATRPRLSPPGPTTPPAPPAAPAPPATGGVPAAAGGAPLLPGPPASLEAVAPPEAMAPQRTSPPPSLPEAASRRTFSAAAADMDIDDDQPQRQLAAGSGLQLEGVEDEVVEECIQWLELSVGCERFADRVAVLSEAHAADPDLLRAAASDPSRARAAARRQLEAAVRRRTDPDTASEPRRRAPTPRIPPGFEDHPLARRLCQSPSQTLPRTRPPHQPRSQPQIPPQTAAAVARALRGLVAGAPSPRYPVRERRAAGAWYASTSTRVEGRRQRPSQP